MFDFGLKAVVKEEYGWWLLWRCGCRGFLPWHIVNMYIIYDGQMLDITGVEVAQVLIDRKRGVIHVNTEDGCVLRLCRIKQIEVEESSNGPCNRG